MNDPFHVAPASAMPSERIVAGSCLLGAEHVDEAATILSEDDFQSNDARLIFATARGLAEGNQPVNAAAVFAELARVGRAEEVGGAQLLADLLDEAGVGANLEFHARRVRDAALLRRLNHLASEMAAATRSTGEPAEDLIARFEQRLFDIGRGSSSASAGPVDARDVIADALQRIDDRQTDEGGKLRGVPTGFDGLDDLLGGLRPGTLTIVAARPSVGKSSLAAGFLLGAATAGVSSLFVSLEMSREEIGERLLAMLSGVDLKRIGGTARLYPGEANSVCSVSIGTKGRVWIDDRSSQTVARISSTARRAIRRHGVGLVVVDYLQLVHPENARDPRHLQVGMVATRLKELARTAKVPVVALAQLNREIENRADGQPKLSDLRDSGQIEQDADTVILLHPMAAEPGCQTQDIDALVEKNRNGPRGKVPLTYRRPNVRFEPRSVEFK